MIKRKNGIVCFLLMLAFACWGIGIAQAASFELDQLNSKTSLLENGCGQTIAFSDLLGNGIVNRPCNSDHWTKYTGNGNMTHTITYTHHYSGNGAESDQDATANGGTEGCSLSLMYTVPPTCKAGGYEIHSCNKCGSGYKTNFTNALGCKANGTWYPTDDGSKHYSLCTKCFTPVYGTHTEAIAEAVPPTCTTTGLTEYKYCSVCNAALKHRENVPATGHTEVIDEAVSATCTATGLTEGKHCSACNTVLVKQETVPATGHTVAIDKAVSATCTTAGLTEGKHCSVCNTVLVKQEVVPAQSHIFQLWLPAGAHQHTAHCSRNHCTHVGKINCTLFEFPMDSETFWVCPVCGESSGGIWEAITNANCKAIERNALPGGELIVRGAAMPLGTISLRIEGIDGEFAPCYGMTVAYERGGRVEALCGRVEMNVPVEADGSFVLLRRNGETATEAATWTEISSTMENGVLTFETDREGLFMLIPVK